MRLPDTSRLRAGWRLVRIPVILVVLYLALHPVLTALSASHGFGSPDGLGLGFLTVSAMLVTLRIVLLVVVPAVVTYRVVVWGVTHALCRDGSPTLPSGVTESGAPPSTPTAAKIHAHTPVEIVDGTTEQGP